jgi:hypothetical protein
MTPTCYHKPNHQETCTCGVRQYPWHDLDGLILEKRGNPLDTIANTFDKNTYNICLRYLGNNKAPGPNNIPNSILKNMPKQFNKVLYLFFHQCYKQQQIPNNNNVQICRGATTIMLRYVGEGWQCNLSMEHRLI